MNQSELGQTIDKVASRRIGTAPTERMVLCKDTQQYEMKMFTNEKAMAFTTARHFIARSNFSRDPETLQTREQFKLVLGPDNRSSDARKAPKFAKLPVDDDATSISKFIKLMNAVPPTIAEE